MNGSQYEEFCRLSLSKILKIPIEEIQSCRIKAATQPGLPEYTHQIDFYWEEVNVGLYKNFADAKWRGSRKVSLGEIKKLQQTRDDIKAHKAWLITNTDFTRTTRDFAKNNEIALLIICPNFDYTTLHANHRPTMQTQLQKFFSISEKPYTLEIVHRAFDLGTDAETQSGVPNETVAHSKEIRQAPMNRMAQPTSHQRVPSGTQKVQGGRGGPRTGGRGGTVQKGPGPLRGGGGGSNRGR
ncbi:hypothetical protein C6503_16350 [Candidatus Poribacteria bacterium]|nr:MAG: hypothetical protein C6503_16350 [Candidatus Poribacteria bacterium]